MTALTRLNALERAAGRHLTSSAQSAQVIAARLASAERGMFVTQPLNPGLALAIARSPLAHPAVTTDHAWQDEWAEDDKDGWGPWNHALVQPAHRAAA